MFQRGSSAESASDRCSCEMPEPDCLPGRYNRDLYAGTRLISAVRPAGRGASQPEAVIEPDDDVMQRREIRW